MDEIPTPWPQHLEIEDGPLAATLLRPRPEARTSDPPVVLVHGLGGTRGVWGPVLEQLAARTDVLALDLPGFGASVEPPGRWSLEVAAEAVRATAREALGERPYVLAGHSLGGGVSVQLALDHPDEVAGLVLVSPAGFRGSGDGTVSERAEELHRRWRMVTRRLAPAVLRVRPARERIFANLAHDTATITAEEAIELARGSADGRSTPQARAAILAADLLDDVRRIEAPTRIVWGVHDRVTSARMAPELARRIPGAELDLLERVGHMPMWERPGVVVAAIESVVARGRDRTPPGHAPVPC